MGVGASCKYQDACPCDVTENYTTNATFCFHKTAQWDSQNTSGITRLSHFFLQKQHLRTPPWKQNRGTTSMLSWCIILVLAVASLASCKKHHCITTHQHGNHGCSGGHGKYWERRQERGGWTTPIWLSYYLLDNSAGNTWSITFPPLEQR